MHGGRNTVLPSSKLSLIVDESILSVLKHSSKQASKTPDRIWQKEHQEAQSTYSKGKGLKV